MNRRQRFALSRFERHTVAEDPQLDRLLRNGFPPTAHWRRYRLLAVVGAVLAAASLFVGYSWGILVGLAALLVGLRQLRQMRRRRTVTGLRQAGNPVPENHDKGLG